jgi:hypothetical protein
VQIVLLAVRGGTFTINRRTRRCFTCIRYSHNRS